MEEVKYAKPLKINRKENLKNHKWYWIGRRTQDVILSLLALVVLSPVMLITAIAIMIDDPSAGPIFSQIRIGRNGKPFKFYKFRSMCANAETLGSLVWVSLSARPASMSCRSCGTS